MSARKLCRCGFELQPGEKCYDCGDRNNNACNAVALLAERQGMSEQELLEMELAILNKISATIQTQSNTLKVTGFLREADPKGQFGRAGVLMIVVNGRQSGLIVPLPPDIDAQEAGRRMNEAVCKHVSEEIIKELPWIFQRGQFQKIS